MIYNKSSDWSEYISSDAKKIYRIGKQNLKTAKTNQQYAKAYSKMAYGLYKMEVLSDALFYYKKVDSLSNFTHNLDDKFVSTFFITEIYNKAGLDIQAKNSQEKLTELSSKINKTYADYMFKHREASLLESENNFCEAAQLRKSLVETDEDRYKRDLTLDNQLLLINSYLRLAYGYFKCGEQKLSGQMVQKAENHIKNIQKNQITIFPFYYLLKALHTAEAGQNQKDYNIWFEKALETARANHESSMIIRILEERVNYVSDDDFKTRTKLFAEYQSQKKNTKKELLKIINLENESKIKTIQNQNRDFCILLIISVFGLFSVFILKRLNRRKQKKRFEEIILKNKNVNQTNRELPEKIKEDIEVKDLNHRIMSDEKESELLYKLLEFEKEAQFLEKNFSISNMASIFDTNSKYISFILHTHRDKNFSDYINSLRINHIVKLLKDHPEYLNYKISYLSDLSGYSSHSRFASVFKKETGLSPSEFINMLSNPNQITE